MNKESENKIIELNKDFYKITSSTFSKSRNYTWSGWEVLLKYITENGYNTNNVLDLACGNGRFVESLKKHSEDFNYLGIDADDFLLEEAKKKYKSQKVKFLKLDLMNSAELSNINNFGKFDLIVMFGFMHHVPSTQKRVELFNIANSLLSEEGLFCFSVWDFPGKKYEERVNKNEIAKELDFTDSLIDKNDYLLDWREGKRAYRFAHYYTETEINELLSQTNYEQIHAFAADGRDSKSNRYFVLKKKP